MTNGKNGAVRAPQNITWVYKEGQNGEGFPWGPHKLPLTLDLAGVSLVFKKRDQGFLYQRNGAGECVEKIVLADKGSIFLSPVEPVHKPLGASTHVLVEFDQSVVVEPRTKREILVTFPLEIACALGHSRDGEQIIDIIAPSSSKFTLYGNVRGGFVCKYWKSTVYTSKPAVSPFEKGVMKIEIQNPGSRWAEVNMVVFSAFGMKIFYSPQLVSLHATMKINSELTAETNFIDKPLQAEMSKALEQFSSKLLSQQGRTVMEEGY